MMITGGWLFSYTGVADQALRRLRNIDSSPIAITPDAPLTNTPPPQHKQADHEGNSLLQVMKSHPNVKKTSLPPAYFVPYSSQEPVLTIYILHANRASV